MKKEHLPARCESLCKGPVVGRSTSTGTRAKDHGTQSAEIELGDAEGPDGARPH